MATKKTEPKQEQGQQRFEVFRMIDGDYQTRLTDKFRNRQIWRPKEQKKILSFIPGTMVTVDVKAGDRIKVGETLVTFNAMKMLNTYKSPIEGVVKKVYVKEGEVVPKGVLLVEFK